MIFSSDKKCVAAAVVCCIIAAAIIGCGGSGGGPVTSTATGTTATTSTSSTATASTSTATTSTATTSTATTATGATAGTTGNGILPSNVIFYAMSNGTTYDVDTIAPTGGASTTFAAGVSNSIRLFAINPVASGRYVFFADPTNGGAGPFGLYTNSTLAVNTSATTLVNPVYTDALSLSITQDGTRVVYSAFNSANTSNLYSIPVTGGTPTLLDISDGSSVGTSSFDTVIYSKIPSNSLHDQVFTRNLSNGIVTQLTSDATGDHLAPVLSRDGKKFAFLLATATTQNFEVETISNASTVVLPNPSNYTLNSAAFSGDGSTLVITGVDSSAVGQLYTQSVSASSSPTPLIASSSNLRSDLGVYWSTSNGRSVGGGLLNAILRFSRHPRPHA